MPAGPESQTPLSSDLYSMEVVDLLHIPKPAELGTDLVATSSIPGDEILVGMVVPDDYRVLEGFERARSSVLTGVTRIMSEVDLPHLGVLAIGIKLPVVLGQLQKLIRVYEAEEAGGLVDEVTTQAVLMVPLRKDFPLGVKGVELEAQRPTGLDFVLELPTAARVFTVGADRIEIGQIAQMDDCVGFYRPADLKQDVPRPLVMVGRMGIRHD